MFEIDRIPENVKAAFRQSTVPVPQVEISAFCDMDPEQRFTEVYLLATKDTLFVVQGKSADSGEQTESKGKSKSKHKKDREKSWTIQKTDRYPLETLQEIKVEEQLSTGRMIAKSGGQTLLLSSFSNFCKQSVFIFVKYLNRLKNGETLEIEEKDSSVGKCCPKCGMRYPDPDRKVCPNCMEKGKLYKKMGFFLSKYRASLIAVLATLVLLTAMSIITPFLSGKFFYDEVIFGTGQFYGEILLVLGLIVSTKLLNTLATVINNRVTTAVGAKMVFDLKKTIFSSIQRLSLRFFNGRQTGGLMTQVNDDSNTIYAFFTDDIPYFIVNAVKVTVLTVLLFCMQPLLAVCALSTVPVFFLLIRLFYRKNKKLYARRYSGSKSLNAFLADVFSGMRIVKAFSKEELEGERFSERSETLAKCDKDAAIFQNYSGQIASVMLYLGSIITWCVGGWMVITNYGGLTFGTLMTFITYVKMIQSPLEFFATVTDRSADCSNAMQRLFEIMESQPDVMESEHPEMPDTLTGSVEFDHVSFSYEKNRKVIDDVSFSVPEGSILGIVGHTGAGKSTLANLIMRLYDADDGEIRIGGYNVKNLAFSTLYQNIAIVSQETFLFMGTILDNIRYARQDATYEEVIEASKCAGAHEFIMKLPDAYHTKVGFGFQDLSGGERQRVSIARAILKNPKILILDEATAAMDTGTERNIQRALSRLVVGKTTIMIAHRLSTLRDADKLIVIQDGKIEEAGTHESLLSKEDGIYHKLYTLQTEALKSAGVLE